MNNFKLLTKTHCTQRAAFSLSKGLHMEEDYTVELNFHTCISSCQKLRETCGRFGSCCINRPKPLLTKRVNANSFFTFTFDWDIFEKVAVEWFFFNLKKC